MFKHISESLGAFSLPSDSAPGSVPSSQGGGAFFCAHGVRVDFACKACDGVVRDAGLASEVQVDFFDRTEQLCMFFRKQAE